MEYFPGRCFPRSVAGENRVDLWRAGLVIRFSLADLQVPALLAANPGSPGDTSLGTKQPGGKRSNRTSRSQHTSK